MAFGYLTILLLFPLAGALVLAGIPGKRTEAIRRVTLGVSA